MSNVMVVAKKEFGDLIRSKVVTIIVLVFLFMFLVNVVQNWLIYQQYGFGDDARAVRSLFGVFIAIVSDYGSLVALMLGFSAVYNERRNGALNTLLSKPLYRVTVINGKLVCALVFLSCMTVASTIMYVALLLVLYGSAIMPYLGPFFGLLPLALLVSFITMAIVYSVSVLFAIAIRDTATALLTCVLYWIVMFNVVPSQGFAGNLAVVFNNNIFSSGYQAAEALLLNLSPKGIANVIIGGSTDLPATLSGSINSLLVLLAYLAITIAISYGAFLWRDIS